MRVLLVCVVLLVGKARLGENEFLPYPNPACNFFSITIPIDCERYQIDVFDAKGKIVYTNPFVRKGETKINCRDWIPGVYVVAIQAGDIRKTYKLVKN
ncbi:MAG TPA: T9SS type A sorting domain-containing protein [Flavobacteriales bacterium]|nr:T9SS type A sorting domain-containing protein [Flavobacteriales bacterium]